MKRLILFLLFVAGIFFANAQQYTSYMAEDVAYTTIPDYTGMSVLTATWQDQYIVSVHQLRDVANASDSIYLCLADASTVISMPITLPIPDLPIVTSSHVNAFLGIPIIVKDIFICDDYAFVCGQANLNGFVAYIDLQAVLAGNNPSIEARCINPNTLPIGTCINKIVAYPDAGSYHVVGTADDGACYYVVEFADIMNNLNSFDYMDLEYNAPNHREFADDVLLVDGKVVVVGHRQDPTTNDVCIRMSDDLDNVISGGGAYFLNTAYVFANTSTSFEVNMETRSTALYDNFIMVSYVHFSETAWEARVRYRTIDLGAMADVVIQDRIEDGKEEPYQKIYLSGTGMVYASTLWNGTPAVEAVDPFSVNTSTVMVYTNPSDYTSIARLTDDYFVTMTERNWHIQCASAMLSMSLFSCVNAFPYPMIPINPVVGNPISTTPGGTQEPLNSPSIPLTPNTDLIPNSCYE